MKPNSEKRHTPTVGINPNNQMYIQWGGKLHGEYCVLVPDELYAGYEEDIKAIHKCVNMHDELVACLDSVLALMNEEGREYWRAGLVNRIEQALSHATKGAQ